MTGRFLKVLGIVSGLMTRSWGTDGRRQAVMHTEYFPAFTESFAVVRVDHVDDGVTVVIVSWPN